MSSLPLVSQSDQAPFYGDPSSRHDGNDDETQKLLGNGNNTGGSSGVITGVTTREVISDLFLHPSISYDLSTHPKTNPKSMPINRFKRHRNRHIYQLNQFRHWWKTSRLLVRLSGGYEYCKDEVNWMAMAQYNLKRPDKHPKHLKKALKSMKQIGRGGPSNDFLSDVKPFTRSIRIILAFARGLEARVDNRFVEVMLAEAFAFMGNRCSRWVGREAALYLSKLVMFPYVGGQLMHPNLDQHSRPIIILMGFLRAILPFALSFQGSRFGRQVTYNTYKHAYFRWNPVQSLKHFHQNAGVYQDTVLDAELEEMACSIAVALGHGLDPVTTRESVMALGFDVFASGKGGHLVFRKEEESGKTFFVHVTPYGPGILGELPRYLLLERRLISSVPKDGKSAHSDTNILDAAIPPQACIAGFTYSGAFFKPQEWAALTKRYNDTLVAYENACRLLGTVKELKGGTDIRSPPKDLLSLKAFIRSGNEPRKIGKDKKRWRQISDEVTKLSARVAKYQREGTAPKKVILYLEGLDCTAKSSTGGLIFSALEGCGYTVRTAQHNRPPTSEQRSKPWMDRGRFEYPEDVYEYGEEIPEYASLVWDRGPAGDFVYGNFAELDEATKEERYDEFRTYDARCRHEGVLFCKLLFIADKDSIAATLGKRLAHKKIARDLRCWLDANSVEQDRVGLDEIEMHIDPTDFVAFNNYKRNLSIFAEFARKTDYIGGQLVDSIKPGYSNPWTVVNTARRHPARLDLLRTFDRQLQRFAQGPKPPPSLFKRICKKLNITWPYMRDDAVFHIVKEDKYDTHLSLRALIQAFVLFLLVIMYLYTTWKVDVFGAFDDD